VSVARTGDVGARRPRTGGGRQPRAPASPWANPQRGDKLTAILGLLAKHRKVLADRLQIATSAALARGGPQGIIDAMSGQVRPTPSVEKVVERQEFARPNDEGAAAQPDEGAAAKSEEAGAAESEEAAAPESEEAAAAEPPDWERVAAFVLSFEQRQVEGRPERQLVAQQAETEAEQEGTSWPTWDPSGLSDWLQQKLADVGGHDQAAPPQGQPARAERTPETGPGHSPGEAGMRSGRGRLRIRLVTIADTTGRVRVVSDDQLTAQAVTCTVPGRLEVQVAGAETRRDVQVALRFARTGQLGWSPHEPTTASADGTAKIELTEVPTGQYEARVLAWTPDASAEHVAVGLGILTIR
jgi:hypothetical protein